MKHKGFKGHKGHHHGKKHGGEVHPEHDVYAGEHSNVVKEAEEKKSGGRAGKKKGGRSGFQAGGEVSTTPRRLDRPGRKRGGSVGADHHPLTSAAHSTKAESHTADTGMAESPTHVEDTNP